MPPRLRLGHLQYRLAGWTDWVKVIANQLWDIMYRFGLSREQVVSWLESLVPGQKRALRVEDLVFPRELTTLAAKLLADHGVPTGLFVQALIHELETNTPRGYRPRLGDDGQHYVERQQHGTKSPERPMAKGKKFYKKVFVGAWWHTDNPKSKANQEFQKVLRRVGGGVFLKVKESIGVTQYYGYAIVPESEAIPLGIELHKIGVDLLAESPTRDFRLSAAQLDSLANRELVKGTDVITHTGVFLSEKFNWEFDIVELLNGRVKNQDISGAIKEILRQFDQ